jgi:hypothetical protein
MVPSLLALMPLSGVADITPAGSSSGGQLVAHEPVHMIVPPASDARSYKVNPFASTRTVPTLGTELVPIVTDPPWADVPLLGPELGVVLFAHADMTRATAETVQISRTLPLDIFAIVPPSSRALWDPNEGTGLYLGSTDQLRLRMSCISRFWPYSLWLEGSRGLGEVNGLESAAFRLDLPIGSTREGGRADEGDGLENGLRSPPGANDYGMRR